MRLPPRIKGGFLHGRCKTKKPSFGAQSVALRRIIPLKNPHPPYPIVARKKGLQGKLILKVSINNDGSVKSVVVRKSSGHKILDKVSKETVEKWVFIPAKKMGKPVEANLKVPIRFVLTE